MRMYSVSEAIGPAWERTKLVLRTGRWGSNIKIAFVVLLAELGSLFFFPVQMFPFAGGGQTGMPHIGMQIVAVISLLLGLVFTVIYACLFYFGSRMQLTLLDLVLTRTHTVAPLWRRHSRSTWRWMAVKMLPSVLFLCGMVPFLIAFAHAQHAMQVQPGMDPQVMAQAQKAAMKHVFAAVFAVSAVYVLLAGGAMLLYSHLRDFVMPYLGIDQLSIGDALQRWLGLWQAYPGQMLGYVLFRILLVTTAAIGFYIAFLVALGIPAALAVLVGVLIKFLVHGSAGTVLVVLYAVLAVLLFVVWYVVLTLFGISAFGTFFQCYSLYFLGGRDPRIGALLEPEAAVPVWTPPPSLPREDDDDSGPDLPANPALA